MLVMDFRSRDIYGRKMSSVVLRVGVLFNVERMSHSNCYTTLA